MCCHNVQLVQRNYSVTLYSVTLARTIWLPDDGPRAETCRSVFNVLMCKFHKFHTCAVVGMINELHCILHVIVLLC